MALRGVKVIELAGLAPGPFCGMVLSDFGASVIRVDRVDTNSDIDCLANGKQSIAIDLKRKKGIEIFRKLCKNSDVLIDTYRPGVLESLKIGPNVLLDENPKLIYTRLTGYGQYGSLANKAGHDINFVSLSGLLSMIGRSDEKPFPPLNMLASFCGGASMCTIGILMALLERTNSGKGQIIDANMVEGAAYLGSWIYRSQIFPFWGNKRGKNMLDGGSHFYEVYETKDGKYMGVGAIEPKFYVELLKGLNLSPRDYPQFENIERSKEVFTKIFLEKTQKEWNDIFKNIDACVTPVLTRKKATEHSHNVERKSFIQCSDQENLIPAPAPKLNRTPGMSQAMEPKLIPGKHTELILKNLSYTDKEISEMEAERIVNIYKESKM